MLARSRQLDLASRPVPGPVLVPSVSSKGFPLLPHNDVEAYPHGLSEAGLALELAIGDLDEALLVSAYDLHHRLLPDAARFLGADHAQTMYASPRLLVVDSGGYELNRAEFESGEQRRDRHDPKAFTRADFEAVADQLPETLDLLVVSYDDPHDDARPSYKVQRETAQGFFEARKHLRSDFLIKPEAGSRTLDVARLTVDARNLRCFNVVGVTEKELGGTLLDSLLRLANLRRLLDDSGCETIPIHVFGSLDPLMTTLYFMAGAEIFDGLSWLRYAYHDGVAVHPEAPTVLAKGRIESRLERRDALRHISNLQEIRALQQRLMTWHDEPDDYVRLGPRWQSIKDVYDVLVSRLKQKG